MTKQEAIRLFDTSGQLVRALGITRQALSQWPQELPQHFADRVIGAAMRTGRALPAGVDRRAGEDRRKRA